MCDSMGDNPHVELNPALPYVRPIYDGPMLDGKAVTVTIRIPHTEDSTGFFIAMGPTQTLKPETTLRCLVLFDGLHAKSIELNYMDDEKWMWPPKMVEPTCAGDLIQRGKDVDIKISAHENGDAGKRELKVFVDTTQLDLKFPVRTNLTKITYLHIRGIGRTKPTVTEIKTERVG